LALAKIKDATSKSKWMTFGNTSAAAAAAERKILMNGSRERLKDGSRRKNRKWKLVFEDQPDPPPSFFDQTYNVASLLYSTVDTWKLLVGQASLSLTHFSLALSLSLFLSLSLSL
jgi:hypothetical protein